MTKVFISQPMRDKTNEEIREEREKAIAKAKEIANDEVEVIDSFFEDAPHDAKPVWFLGKSLIKLSNADIAVFTPGWDKYRGCKIEHLTATEYGIKVVEL